MPPDRSPASPVGENRKGRRGGPFPSMADVPMTARLPRAPRASARARTAEARRDHRPDQSMASRANQIPTCSVDFRPFLKPRSGAVNGPTLIATLCVASSTGAWPGRRRGPDNDLPPSAPLHEDHLVAHLQSRCGIDTEPPEERRTVQSAGGPPQRPVVGAGLLQATLGNQTGGVGLGGRIVGRGALGPDALGGLVRSGSEVGNADEPPLPLARPQETLGVGAEGVRELLHRRGCEAYRLRA
jgi:hypothetical protein